MPRISAATVAEHRALVQRRLVDAAEEILRSGEPETMTAAAVTKAAGIARNSIYRYVDSVDDLFGMVLERHLPEWIDGVAAELASVADPTERITVWLRANLEQAERTGHGWLMGLGRNATLSDATAKVMDSAHAIMRDVLATAWTELAPDAATARVGAGLTRGLLEAGFRQLDQDADLQRLVALSTAAARGMIASLTAA